jgi:hypothetical protein
MPNRPILCLVFACFTTALGTLPALSYEGPWCIKAIAGRAAIDICHFRTYEACARERMNWSPSSFCVQNPAYRGGRGGWSDDERPVRRVKRKRR